jgi:hypothetical protein
MRRDCNFYLCPTCFTTAETQHECHGHVMIYCGDLQPGDERLKPVFDKEGNLKSRAPRWFLESLGIEIHE